MKCGKSYVAEATLGAPPSNNYYSGILCRDTVWTDPSFLTVKDDGVRVNYKTLGKYTTTFTCTNPAPWKKSNTCAVTVVVSDTTKPKCKKMATLNLEASFPFTPSSLYCDDHMDGKRKGVVVFNDVDVEKAKTYTVKYAVSDKSGNTAYVTQKVVVRDTLKPTIGLMFGKKLIHKTNALDTGVRGEANPAHDHFMAQVTSSNAAILAFFAAAVGVALVATGKKSESVIEQLV